MAEHKNSTQPWYAGFGGVTNLSRAEAAAWCRGLLTSDEYRQKLKKRLEDGSLPPAIETMLWAYGFGKPTENIALEVNHTLDLSQLTPSEMLKQMSLMARQLEEAEAIENSIPAEVIEDVPVAPTTKVA